MPQVIELGESLNQSLIPWWLANIFVYLRILALILGVIFIIYSAFLFFSSTKEENIKTGKKTIIFSLIGVAVSFMAFFIFTLILSFLGPEVVVEFDPSMWQYAGEWSKTYSSNYFNYKEYIRDVTRACREIAKAKTFGGVPVLSARFCGRVVITSRPKEPCYGYLTIKGPYRCCDGLEVVNYQGTNYCLETCDTKSCRYGKCTEVDVGGTKKKLCL